MTWPRGCVTGSGSSNTAWGSDKRKVRGFLKKTWRKHMANALLTGCTTSGVVKTMDERLKQLVMKAQRFAPQSEERQQALNELVDEMLRSRKICRQAGQSLSGVYQEIYQQLRQQLLRDVDEALPKYNPQHMTVREWAKELRDNVFRKVLDDTQLKKLALEAQRHPPNTESRQQALIELVNALLLSGRLCHPYRNQFPDHNIYKLIYEDAVNQTLIYVCKKIDTYDPQRTRENKFITWVNFRLDKIVKESQINLMQQTNTEIPTLAELEDVTQQEEHNMSELLRQCLEEDPKNMFKNEHIRDHPNANFQAIALATLSGRSWEEISAEFGIRVPTLSCFFQRSCQKFAPILREYL